ncbi:MAG TPA: hypothetical protein VK254_01605 [Candidatus Bathyarchaeia archaeon]|nr:hypothetical protein [Candidatus Bathyarchaeia archaeon]
MRIAKKSTAVLTLASFVLAGFALTADAKKGGNHASHTKVFNSAIVASNYEYATDFNDISITIKNVTYTLKTSSTTKILRKYNAKADFSEITAGDNLKIWGTLDTTGVTPTIIATKVRDNSIQKLGASFQGTVSDIASVSAVDGSHLTVTTKHRGIQTVDILSTFALRPYKGTAKTVADLHVGDQIIVKGIWNTNSKTIYNVTWMKIKKLATTPTT